MGAHGGRAGVTVLLVCALAVAVPDCSGARDDAKAGSPSAQASGPLEAPPDDDVDTRPTSGSSYSSPVPRPERPRDADRMPKEALRLAGTDPRAATSLAIEAAGLGHGPTVVQALDRLTRPYLAQYLTGEHGDGVRNRGQASITTCEGGSGGGTVFTADYAIDIPDVGQTARVAVPHGHNFEPKKAEAFHLTLGTGNGTGRDDKKQIGDVFALEVFLVEDNGSVFEVGPLTVASTPATAADIKKLQTKGYPLSDPVENLRAGLLKTADAVSKARR
ncbi:hypothetical protein ACQKM2_20095 [Streptomyces sp. NPDC004126]|uniref:hypothetical protein n=1 Tax=Streptomyces sp. NPDC004126 TaxID=3390695 RepID=UPI003D031222